MKGHLGAVMTSGLAAIALALALLQAAVLAHSAPRHRAVSAVRPGPTNRFSIPGGRSGIPWLPFDAQKAQQHEDLKSREGRSPATKPPQEHRAPPPSRQQRMFPPSSGPHPSRRLAA
jgi:hypothetical protein